jgi:hypothetical protein
MISPNLRMDNSPQAPQVSPQQCGWAAAWQQQTSPGYGHQAPPLLSLEPSEAVAASPDGQVYYYNERSGATQWGKAS